VAVVRGYKKEAIDLPGIATVDNDAHAETGELASLACAVDRLAGHSIVVYGDVLFRRHILDGLIETDADIAVAVDALAASPGRRARVRDLAAADRRFSGSYLDEEPALLRAIGAELPPDEVVGEWIGLVRFSPRGAEAARAEIAAIEAEGRLAIADLPELLTRLAGKHRVVVHYVTGHWLDVDDLADLAEARNFP
jgi:phosphoenolpyruvate phosphomutase